MPGLFDPLALGPVELPCRIVSTSHQTTLVHDHLPTDDFVAYHEARARGGTGLIVLEATAVDPSGLLTPHTLGGYLPEIVEGYRRVAQAVRPHGTRLFVQLFHGGREQIAGGAARAGGRAFGRARASGSASSRARSAAREIDELSPVTRVAPSSRGRRARRSRGIRSAPLPGRAVRRPEAQPPRRRMG